MRPELPHRKQIAIMKDEIKKSYFKKYTKRRKITIKRIKINVEEK